MPFAVELYLDDDADKRVRSIWEALDAGGVQSLGSVPRSAYRPHVSLAVFDSGDGEVLDVVLREALQKSLGLVMSLPSLGFFLAEEPVAFLGVVPSVALLAAHRVVVDALAGVVIGYWPYYEPDALMPHCTLATAVREPAKVTQIVAGFGLPIVATITSAGLVEVPGGKSRLEVR